MEDKRIDDLKTLERSYRERLSKLNAMADESLSEGIASYVASQGKTLLQAQKAEEGIGQEALALVSSSLKQADSQANEAILKCYLAHGVKGVKGERR